MSDQARAKLFFHFEMSDPPTIEDMRTFLRDPEVDFTPADLVKWLREKALRDKGDHRHCAGCPLCSDLWILEHAADYFEVALAIIESVPSALAADDD